jgi:hypothetical protein
MVSAVSDLEQPLATAVSALDPAALLGGEARRELLAVIRMRKQLDGAFIRLLGRVEETRSWTGEGDRSLQDWVLRKSGSTYGEVKRATDTAALLPEAPAVDEALKNGSISADQAAALAPAEKAAPAQGGRLVERAGSQTLKDTRQAADRARAAARTPDQDAQRSAKQQARRRLEFGTDDDGNGTIDAHLPPEVFAEVKAELERLFKTIFATARRTGRFEPHAAYLADALVEMTRRSRAGTPKKPPAATDDQEPDPAQAQDGDDGHQTDEAAEETEVKPAPASKTAVNVIIDLDTLQGRTRHDGEERCEIAGVGPIPAAWVRDRLGDATLNLFLRNGLDLRTLVTPSRSPTQTIQTCLDILYPTCAIDGCFCTRGLQDHHDTSATGWHDTQRTKLSELTRLCPHHHDLVTYERYTLIKGPTPTTATLKPPDTPAPPRKRWGKNKRRPGDHENANAETANRSPVPAEMGPIALPSEQPTEGEPDG